MNKFFTFLFSIITLAFVACNDSNNKTSEEVNIDTIQESVEFSDSLEAPDTLIPVDGIKRVFYDLASPVELTEFILYSKSTFNPNILNSTTNTTKYSTNIKQALNMGVYGTDLIYCRMYNQKQDAIKYLSVIKTFTQELGIPKSDISSTLGSAENFIEKKDSLYILIRKAYSDADKYLNTNDRDNIASLIYFGAWTESLYIATNMYKEPEVDKKVIGLHIAQQKFAINNLLKLLSNTLESPDITHYAILVKKLKKIYDGIDIVIDRKKSKIDTLTKTIIINEDKTVVTPEQIEEITIAVRRMRADITG